MVGNLGFEREKSAMISRFAKSDDFLGLLQIFTTLVPLALLWLGLIRCIEQYPLLALMALILIILFTVRVFALMHECGHGSLFRSRWLNRHVGFWLGVVAGMPQYVWAQHHNYHHATNGNWDRYRGPYTTLSTDEYDGLTPLQRRLYRGKCSILASPLAGFIYLIFNPRFTWLKGSIGCALRTLRLKCAQPHISIATHASRYQSRYWKSSREYRHMLANNIALLSIWAVMCWAVGPKLFFMLYLTSVSIAGGAGIVLFTVQHNFEHAYASVNASWDRDSGNMEGTSYLVLPRWLNWFTLNIGYHHVHHISPSIPNYRLAQCHHEYAHLFSEVTRVRLSGVLGALKCILWDVRSQQIISVAEHQRRPELSAVRS